MHQYALKRRANSSRILCVPRSALIRPLVLQDYYYYDYGAEEEADDDGDADGGVEDERSSSYSAGPRVPEYMLQLWQQPWQAGDAGPNRVVRSYAPVDTCEWGYA